MSPATVQKNKVVSLTYTLRNERGDVFEYSDLPVSYVHGAGSELFEKVEQALEGHKVGERVVVKLSPEEGFGRHDPKLSFRDDIDNVPPELRRVGAQLEAENARGERLTLTVTAIEGGHLTVDANHPLAGQTVTFEVVIEDVRDATADELRHGRANAPATPLQ